MLPRVLILLLLPLLLSGCAALQERAFTKPQMAITGVRLAEPVGLLPPNKLYMDLQIYNPNNYPLKFKSLAYQVEINGLQLVDGVSTGMEIAASGEEKLVLDVNVNLRSGWRLVQALLRGEGQALAYSVKTVAELANWLFPRYESVEEGSIPLR